MEFISKRRFDKVIKGVTLANACIFLLALLQKSVICWSNLSLESNLTPKSFLQSLLFILKLFTFKLTSWLVAFISITFQKVVFRALSRMFNWKFSEVLRALIQAHLGPSQTSMIEHFGENSNLVLAKTFYWRCLTMAYAFASF